MRRVRCRRRGLCERCGAVGAGSRRGCVCTLRLWGSEMSAALAGGRGPQGGQQRVGGGLGYFTGVGTQAPQSTTPPQPSGMKPQASEGQVAGTQGIIGGSEPTQAPRSNSM